MGCTLSPFPSLLGRLADHTLDPHRIQWQTPWCHLAPSEAAGSGRVGVRVPLTWAVGGLGGWATVLTGCLLLSGPAWVFEWPSFQGRGASILRSSCYVTLLLRENSVFSIVASLQEMCVTKSSSFYFTHRSNGVILFKVIIYSGKRKCVHFRVCCS